MKKLIAMLGLMIAINIRAEDLERVLLRDYAKVPDMDFSYEISTSAYQKVILDCQSFITGINFYNNGKVIHSFYLDAYGQCQDAHQFITFSRENHLPVCLEIDSKANQLNLSNDSNDCQ